ncbi:MAG: hypothetical protein V7L00_19740 [Nostoc sp.]
MSQAIAPQVYNFDSKNLEDVSDTFSTRRYANGELLYETLRER